MRDVNLQNFGFLIAYLVPGFVALWSLSPYSETIQGWIGESAADSPTIGGFLYVTLGSVTAGMLVSTVRWLIVDRIHDWTGLSRPQWNFARLEKRYRSFELLVESHYKFYHFHANLLVAITLFYVLGRLSSRFGFGWPDVVFVVLTIVLFAGSRDNLAKYNQRVADILGLRDRERNDDQRYWKVKTKSKTNGTA